MHKEFISQSKVYSSCYWADLLRFSLFFRLLASTIEITYHARALLPNKSYTASYTHGLSRNLHLSFSYFMKTANLGKNRIS